MSEATRNPMECRVVVRIEYDEYTTDSEVKFTGTFRECDIWIKENWRELDNALWKDIGGAFDYWVAIENDYSTEDYKREKTAAVDHQEEG